MGLLGRVLVIEHAALVRQALCRGLGEAGYVLLAATADGEVGHVIDTFKPDVIVARLDGTPAEQVPLLRRGMETPVIFLASDDAPPGHRVQARRAGADSVFVEPVHIAEVVARVDSLMEHRRTRRVVSVYDLTIDVDGHFVRRNGVELQLTATEFNLLLDLAKNVGVVLSKSQLLDRVWGFDEYDVNVVEAHTSALRRKLEAAGPRLIQTVRGFGYVLRQDGTAEHPQKQPWFASASGTSYSPNGRSAG